jgi:hypothetical protein
VTPQAKLERRLGTFADFRRALLAGVRAKPALAGWRARSEDDLGIMLVELWAYACEAIAFADETIAHESYLRTARLRRSLRDLVGLLGYVPRPAVGASAWLVVLAEGRKPVDLPAGTAFRSIAFDGEPPQVFELEEPATVHPLTNRWQVAPSRPATLADPPAPGGVPVSTLLLEAGGARPAMGQPLLLRAGSVGHARIAGAVSDFTGRDGEPYVRTTLSHAVTLPGTTVLASIELSRPTQTAGLWTLAVGSTQQPAIEGPDTASPRITLDALHRQIRAGATVLLARDGDVRWFRATGVAEVQRAVSEPVTVGTPATVLPAVKVPVTQLTLDASLNHAARRRTGTTDWTAADAAALVLHHALVPAGTPTAELRTRLAHEDDVRLVGTEPTEEGTAPERFVLEDRNGRGIAVEGSLDLDTGALGLDPDAEWEPSLPLPVEVYGNVVRASRGETVAREVLGSGDASLESQSFGLARGPLTYLAAPESAAAVAATLRVWVGGIRWDEAPSFFGTGPEDRVYVVRQDDAGETTVTFGDGLRGARLPTGRDNVVASYRFGAGAATPGPGGITQLARPVPGLAGVRDPAGATGGADAESGDSLRGDAPRSALLLGRAVSIRDLEVAAARVPGVRAVRAEWRWHGERQRPLVQVWYIGSPGIEALVSQSLRALSDPSVPIDVDVAAPVAAALAVELRVDPRRSPDEVAAAVRAALLAPDAGPLAPERAGIGRAVFRSRLFEVAMAVPGVDAVGTLLLDGAPFPPAADPGTGRFFDFEAGLAVTATGGLDA